MPGATTVKPAGKSSTSLVIKLGSHPIVYGVVTILAIGAAVFFFAVAPMVRLIESGGDYSVSDAAAKNESAKAKLDAQNKLLDAVGSISKKNQDLLAYALPSEPDSPGLTIQLNSIAIKSGVKMAGADIGAGSVTGGPGDQGQGQGTAQASSAQVKPLSIAYTVDNINYDRLKILLSSLENSLRLFDVLSLSYSPSAGSVSLELRTYYISNS